MMMMIRNKIHCASVLLLFLFILSTKLDFQGQASAAQVPEMEKEEHDRTYWYRKAMFYLKKKLDENDYISSSQYKKTAKNIILFMGDGMSVPTLTATRHLSGGPGHFLSFEKFPYFGLTKNYCIDGQVTDSAASSTAYLSGVKANYGTIGVNAHVKRSDCKLGQLKEYHTESIAKWAQDADKWTGFVTTARVTDASTAGLYAHVADRNWEYDGRIQNDKCSHKDIKDIARQLVEGEVGKKFRVILGGGLSVFFNKNVKDFWWHKPGKRTVNQDLLDKWHLDKPNTLNVTNRVDLLTTFANNISQYDYLFGLFSASHMPYHYERKEDLLNTVPTLSEMTKAAIEFLNRHDQGYFLFVENAHIDMAHHETYAKHSLEETAEFSRAVEVAVNMTSKLDTLIVVIADHSHTMTISDDAPTGSDILHLNNDPAADHKPYTILMYANGPSYNKTMTRIHRRTDLSYWNFGKRKVRYPSGVPLKYETHGGDDTGVFALGPNAELFSGNYENSYLPFLMAKAAEIGPFLNYTDTECEKM